ncbi:MAG: hypothetical protein IJN04_05540 [Clostridia bacterium]|nr:hypothetical protein [Clostridia bacterium]
MFKRLIVTKIALLVAVCMIFVSGCVVPDPNYDPNPNTVNLGIPTADWYSYNLLARCVWDMTIYDGKLYVGCGDYVNNTGGVPVMYCSLDDLGNWQRESIVLDEQIGRFLVLDDKLTIPGWDPKGSPESGTYYQLEDGKWLVHSGLPDGLHNFDLVRYDGKLFAGIGAHRGETPIVVSENGTDFERVPMLRNGVPVDTNDGECIRTYNLWVLNDVLYADFYYENMTENKNFLEVYRYEDGKFIWCVGLGKKLNFNGIGSSNLPKPWADAVVDDTLFITTGRLYMTTNMVDFTEISFPNDRWIYDLYMYDGKMYLLTASSKVLNSDGAMNYYITVYSAASANPYEFKEEFSFNDGLQPTSLAVSDDGYFISFGDWNSTTNEQNGQVMYRAKE